MRCDNCHGKKTINNKKCDVCNGTGLIRFERFEYKVPSDLDTKITDIFDERINREITELKKLSRVTTELEHN